MTHSDTAVADVPAVDVWAFAQEKNPSLDSLFAVKQAVLLHRPLKHELEKHLSVDPQSPMDKRNDGVARWMLAQYHRAYPLLKESGMGGQAMSFILAECCLKAEVAEGGARSMRRPDLASKLLGKHDRVVDDPRVWALWCEALLFDEDREGFAAALKKAPAAARNGADFRYFEGRAAEFDADLVAASAAYEDALARDAEHGPSLFRLAVLSDRVGDDDAALSLYERLADLRPANIHALINLGVLYEDLGRYQDAVRCYERILDEFPNHRRANQYLKDAKASLTQVIEDDHERRGDRNALLLRMPIADFELSPRARNCLAKLDVQTFGDLVRKTEAELMSVKSFGEGTLQEIRALVAQKGFRLGYGTAEAAAAEAAGDLIDVPDVAGSAKGPVPVPAGIEPRVLNVQLSDIELPLRCRKALVTLKVQTVGDLLTHTEAELLSLKNFGLTSLNELKAKLAEYGVTLRAS
ncbi:MAG TPA: DNA-directed RNA polymerase subunit alpha C-terminal domain-containing protein [Planctomycetota bacterium]|nr:DNA-directed RNA polymerase subunit alpha C-terminal domain-containing protein [Planctomycetota bacterium]